MAGHSNGTIGNDSLGLNSPIGIYVATNDDIYVTDRGNQRVQRFSSGSRFGTTVAGNGSVGWGATQFYNPYGIYVDPMTYDIYIGDFYNSRVQLWRANATQGQTVIGSGTHRPYVPGVGGVRRDSMGNIYVSDYFNSQVLRWAPNASNATVVAGNGSVASGIDSLAYPWQIDLDATGTNLYVADCNNCRVSKWQLLTNGSRATATIVAGGNGCGGGAHQLSSPPAVYVSRRTGDVYVSDSFNNRIQKWTVNATQGVTVAGSPQGLAGSGINQLRSPAGIALNMNETYLYVADAGNNRIQRFSLN